MLADHRALWMQLSDGFIDKKRFGSVCRVLISNCVGPKRAACGHAGSRGTPKSSWFGPRTFTLGRPHGRLKVVCCNITLVRSGWAAS